MSDGLKFAGDDGQSDTTKIIPKTLNEKLDIVGGAEGEFDGQKYWRQQR